MDENSLEAYKDLDKEAREKVVLGLFIKGGTYTDREAAEKLFGSHHHRALAQPRISEMIKAGILEKVGSKKCQWSDRKCRLVKLLDANKPKAKRKAKPKAVKQEPATPPTFENGETVRLPVFGRITALAPPYATAFVPDGQKRGKWQGLISDLRQTGETI